MTDSPFRCEYCRKTFSQERYYQKHSCTERERALEMETVEGQLAYMYYRTWFKKRRLKPSDDKRLFTKASTYTAFLKFARWVRSTGIVDVELYITLMTERKYSPNIWTRDEAYADYINYYDTQVPPTKQVETTCETLTILAESYGVNLNQVIPSLEMPQLLELIQQRRLSPWLLYSMKSFKSYVMGLKTEDRSHLIRGIGSEIWSNKFSKVPELMKEIRELAAGLDL